MSPGAPERDSSTTQDDRVPAGGASSTREPGASESSPQGPCVRVHARGARVTVTETAVTAERSALASSLWPAVDVRFDTLLGWRRREPTATSPGWIHLLVQDATTNGFIHSDVEGRDNPAVLRFAPGSAPQFRDLDAALTAVQAGYGLGTAAGSLGAPEAGAAGTDEDAATAGRHPDRADVPLADWLTPSGDGSSHGRSAGSHPAAGTAADGQGILDLPGLDGAQPADGATPGPIPAEPRRPASAASSGAPRRGRGSSGRGDRSSAPWDKVATPDEVPETNLQADMDSPVFGQVVVVTGDVAPYDKAEVWAMIADAGGTVAKNVTKKTTLLIVGEWASMTTKEKRARELKDKGQELEIWTLSDFLEKMGKPAHPG